jgi:hypothetical protein
VKSVLKELWREKLDVIFPRSCVHCGGVVEDGRLRHLCPPCERLLLVVKPPHCSVCGHVHMILCAHAADSCARQLAGYLQIPNQPMVGVFAVELCVGAHSNSDEMIPRIVVAAGLMAVGYPTLLPAERVQWGGLLGNSPFGEETTVPVGDAATGTPEFRGMVEEDGLQLFSLYDPDALVATWVGLHEPGHPFTVRGYDSTREMLTIDYRGARIPLPLKRAKAVGGSFAASEPPKVVPAFEIARLTAVAEEVQRRREMRLRAASGQNQG